MSLGKIISLVFFLLLTTGSISQISNGAIVYDVNIDAFIERVKKNKSKKNITTKSSFEIMAEEMHRIHLILTFQDAKSIFQREPGLALDNLEKAFQFAIGFADRGTYFTDLKEEKLVIYREYKGEKILVNSSLKDVNWELTSSQKKIGKFNCYKAVHYVDTSIGKLPITAWYTPEIPVSFGPTDYGGTLPGLILELHTNEISFVCSEIKLNLDKKVNIDWPNTDSAISLEEYRKLNDNLAKSFKRN